MRPTDVPFCCNFCGLNWIDQDPLGEGKPITLNGCKRCSVPTGARKGMRVKYGAWTRCPSDAVYADHHLQRGETYTVTKITQWQHGATVTLEETGSRGFNLRLFVPEGFEITEEDLNER